MTGKILVCTHKNDAVWRNDIYMPIHTGRAISDDKLNMPGDDTGDNISHKNKSYCELTGLYWAWKNLHDVDYVGLCHYRRYFDVRHHFFKRSQYVINTATFKKNQPMALDFERLFSKYDLIVTKPVICPYNLKIHWATAHLFTDLEAVKETIESVSPDYIEAYEKIMNGNKLTGFNMFVGRRDFLEGYCTWLFKILGELERKIEIYSYDSYVAKKNPNITRALAYLGERLLPVYVERHKLKVKHFPILYINDSWKDNGWVVYLYYMRNMMCYYLLEYPQKVKFMIKKINKWKFKKNSNINKH
jgi:hypothetical protein